MTHPVKMSSHCDFLKLQIKLKLFTTFHSLGWTKIPPDPSLPSAPQMPSLTNTRQQPSFASFQTLSIWFKQKIIHLVIFPRYLLEGTCKKLSPCLAEHPDVHTLVLCLPSPGWDYTSRYQYCWYCWEQRGKRRKGGGNNTGMDHPQFYLTSW